jgi:hypothetical protein
MRTAIRAVFGMSAAVALLATFGPPPTAPFNTRMAIYRATPQQ